MRFNLIVRTKRRKTGAGGHESFWRVPVFSRHKTDVAPADGTRFRLPDRPVRTVCGGGVFIGVTPPGTRRCRQTGRKQKLKKNRGPNDEIFPVVRDATDRDVLPGPISNVGGVFETCDVHKRNPKSEPLDLAIPKPFVRTDCTERVQYQPCRTDHWDL